MKVSRESRLVKWAYLFESTPWRWNTNLCALFWRTVLFTPLKLLVPTVLLGMLVYVSWKDPMGALKFLGVMAGLFGVIVFIGFCHWLSQKRVIQDSTLVQGAKAVKGRFCPIIEVEPNP